MEFSTAKKEFLTYITVERNLSPRTIKAYSHDLKNFEAFLGENHKSVKSLTKITTEILREYFAQLHLDRSYKGISLARKVSSLRSFFRFANERGYVKINPMSPVRNPKLPRRLPVYLTQDELKKLLTSPGNKKWIDIRDRAILVLLAMTGIRLQELVQLDVDSIDLDNLSVRVFGKGRKERIIPLNAVAAMVLQDYLKVRPVVQDKALFVNRNGKRLIGRTIEKKVKRYAMLAGLPSRSISPHKLRHTFATLLHQNEVDLLEIQALLGHASITSTQIYTHTSSRRLRDAVDTIEI
jgi:site-specific recombinase XerD